MLLMLLLLFLLRVVKVKLIRTKKLVMIIPVKMKHFGVAAVKIAMHSREMKRIHVYRDKVAEGRTLHGGFGVGPGQKNSKFDEDEQSSSYASANTEEAAAEALNMSFGAGSYARKLLEDMGWKEGDGLGSTTKGMVEPTQAVGNVGNAGLGWPQGIAKHH